MTRGRQTEPGKRLLGYILVTVGILWLLLCGACTVFVWMLTASMNGHFPTEPGPILFPLLIGAVGAAPGLALLLAGRSVLRPKP